MDHDHSLLNHSSHMDHVGHMDHSGHMDHAGHMDHSDDMDINNVIDLTSHVHAVDAGISTHSGMQMYFHFGVEETILFKGWHTTSAAGLIGSMIGIFLLALFYEGLKYFREYLFKKSLENSQYSSACNKPPSHQDRPVQYMDQMLFPAPMHILSLGHFLQTVLHMIQFVISYSLMLIFMTFNVWLCLACTFGAGVGYFLFGWKKSVVVDVTEHCH